MVVTCWRRAVPLLPFAGLQLKWRLKMRSRADEPIGPTTRPPHPDAGHVWVLAVVFALSVGISCDSSSTAGQTGSGGVGGGGSGQGGSSAGTGGSTGQGGGAGKSGGTGGLGTGGGGTGTGGTAGHGSGGAPGTGGGGGSTSSGGHGGGAGVGGSEAPDGGALCSGKVCKPNEFCCGPAACGFCANVLQGPNCATSCN